jgi:hypothetical protein
MELDPQPFRIDKLLRDLSVILSANVGMKPIEVLFDVDPALPPVLVGDAMRLQQVLINLSGNAIKFTEQGEVVIQFKVLERTPQHTTLSIAVRDSGIGIAPENQAHTDGFSQAEASPPAALWHQAGSVDQQAAGAVDGRRPGAGQCAGTGQQLPLHHHPGYGRPDSRRPGTRTPAHRRTSEHAGGGRQPHRPGPAGHHGPLLVLAG